MSTHFSQMTGLCIDSALLQLWSLHSECVCVVWSSGLSLMTSSCTMTSHITQNNTVGVIIKNIDYCFSWITTSRECTYFQNHVPTSSKDLEDLNTLSPLCSSFYTLIIQLETSRFRCSLQLWSLVRGRKLWCQPNFVKYSEKGPTRSFTLLKLSTSVFTIRSYHIMTVLIRHYMLNTNMNMVIWL